MHAEDTIALTFSSCIVPLCGVSSCGVSAIGMCLCAFTCTCEAWSLELSSGCVEVRRGEVKETRSNGGGAESSGEERRVVERRGDEWSGEERS